MKKANLSFGQFYLVPNTLMVDLAKSQIKVTLNISRGVRTAIDNDSSLAHMSKYVVWRKRTSAIVLTSGIDGTRNIVLQAMQLLRNAQEMVLDAEDLIARYKRKCILNDMSPNHWEFYCSRPQDVGFDWSGSNSFPTDDDLLF